MESMKTERATGGYKQLDIGYVSPSNARPAQGLKVGETVKVAILSIFTVGYLMNVIGAVNTILLSSYSQKLKQHTSGTFFLASSFVGVIFGHIIFGHMSDRLGRSVALISSTILVILFSIFSAVSLDEFFMLETSLTLLSVSRMFMGVGIGGVMPAASVFSYEACMDMNSHKVLSEEMQNSLYIYSTTCIMDLGTLASSLVPWILYSVCRVSDPRILSSLSLGLGVFPIILVLGSICWKKRCSIIYFVDEKPTTLLKSSSGTVNRSHKYRLLVISAIWFIYDFMIYPIGYYSSFIITGHPDNSVKSTNLNSLLYLSVVVSFFYLPGSMLAAYAVKYIPLRKVLNIGLYSQAIFGIAMAFLLSSKSAVHGERWKFVVTLALFIASTEFGLGSCISIYANSSLPKFVRYV